MIPSETVEPVSQPPSAAIGCEAGYEPDSSLETRLVARSRLPSLLCLMKTPSGLEDGVSAIPAGALGEPVPSVDGSDVVAGSPRFRRGSTEFQE